LIDPLAIFKALEDAGLFPEYDEDCHCVQCDTARGLKLAYLLLRNEDE